MPTALQIAMEKLEFLPEQTSIEVIKGVSVRKKKNGLTVMRLHYSAIPDRDPQTDKGAVWLRDNKKLFASEARWQREQEIDAYASGGEHVFGKMLSEYYSVVINSDPNWWPNPQWDVVGGFDHGGTNATCLLKAYIPRPTFDRVTGRQNPVEIIIAGEYYSYRRQDWQNNVDQNVLQMKGGQHIVDGKLIAEYEGMPDMDRARWIAADPSIFWNDVQVSQGAPTNIYATYKKNRMFPMVGYDGVRSDVTFVEWIMSDYWKGVAHGAKPRLTIVCRNPSDRPQPGLHPYDCPNLVWELKRAKRVEISQRLLLTKNASDALVDKHNHARDCLVRGTLVSTRNGEIPIECVKVGDEVLTRKGWRKVEDAWLADFSAKVFKVRFSNGVELIGTAGHKIFIKGIGFVRIDDLKYGMIGLCSKASLARQKQSCGWESGSIVIQRPNAIRIANISRRGASISTSLSGYLKIGNQSHRATTFITGTETAEITSRGTLKQRNLSSISGSTTRAERTLANRRSLGSTRTVKKLQTGIQVQRGERGIHSTDALPYILFAIKPVLDVELGFKTKTQRRATPFALPIVGLHGDTIIGSTTSPDRVNSVAVPSSALGTTRLDSVPELVLASVIEVMELSKRRPVFDLTVSEEPEFFANGVLVHNCLKYITGKFRNPTEIPADEHINAQLENLDSLTRPLRARYLMSDLARTGGLNPDGTPKKGKPARVIDLRRAPGVIR